MLQIQLFVMQIGAMGVFCSNVCYKMPVKVCEIVLWLWGEEVFHNFLASCVEIIILRLSIVCKIISYYSQLKYDFCYNNSLLHC